MFVNNQHFYTSYNTPPTYTLCFCLSIWHKSFQTEACDCKSKIQLCVLWFCMCVRMSVSVFWPGLDLDYHAAWRSSSLALDWRKMLCNEGAVLSTHNHVMQRTSHTQMPVHHFVLVLACTWWHLHRLCKISNIILVHSAHTKKHTILLSTSQSHGPPLTCLASPSV